MTEFPVIPPGTKEVIKAHWLPATPHYPACDVATRTEHEVEGEEYHICEIGGRLFVSAKVYELLKKLPTE